MLMSCSSLYAQNLIANPDFEITTGTLIEYTDYSRSWGGGVNEGYFIHDVTSAGHGVGMIGWPNNLTGYGGSGYFLLYNGFGGNQNPTKVAWRQTVAVTTNTTYTFSAQVRNLSQTVGGYTPNPAKMRLKINGVQVGTDYTLPQNNNWMEWSNTWNSGSATQAVIEIYDAYTGNSGLGDDFGIDHLSFIPSVVYSVDAIDDTGASTCLGTYVDIDVLANDLLQPNGNDATVTVVNAPTYGTAVVQTNRKIRYTYTNGNANTDQFKYRVTNHGVYDEAWVHVNLSRPPVVGNIATPDVICAGGVLGLDAPSVTPNLTGQWVSSATQNGTYTAFDPNNIPLSMNGHYVRYSVTNDCGEGHSNAEQITVTNGPSFSGQTPQIQPICAGGSLNLTPPAFNTNGSTIVSQGWVASATENGTYNAFNLNNIPETYNGWYIRYMVEGSCGPVYSQPARLLTVNVSPDITGTLQAPDAICAGDDLSLVAPTYEGNGTGGWESSQNSNGTFEPFTPTNVPSTFNNYYLRYKVSNDCGSDVSNIVQIHVNDAPTIATPATPQAICADGSFGLTTPTIQNNGSTITDQGWQIAAQQNGSFSGFNNNNVPYTYNNYWIRYYAVNDCGTTYSPAVQVTVNDIPLVSNITAPAAICAGGAFNLTTPSVTWRHNNQSTCSGSWEIAPTSSGVFTPLTNNNIPFEYNGYYLRYKAVNGCGEAYSSNVVQVTVYSTEDTFEEITACDTYVWHGVTCNHTGDYTAQVQNENGCTITAHLHFTLSDAYTETQSFTSCESYTWPVNGQTYYSTGTDTYTIESGNPLVCDSIFTLNLIINNAPEVLGSLTAPSATCAGSPLNVTAPQFEMNHVNGGDSHWEYATSANGPFTAFDPATSTLGYGNYFLRFAVVNDCDEDYSEVVPFRINDKPEVHMQLTTIQVCENTAMDLPEGEVIWKNEDESDRIAEWQMAATQNGTFAPIEAGMLMQSSHNGYWLRFLAHNSCGDAVVGPVQVMVISAVEEWLETIVACDAYTLESGQTITESQTLDFETYDPCYHMVHQPIIINHSDYKVEAITSCHDDYEWHGHIFHRSLQTQFAWDTLVNANNCDSIVELNLDFGDYSTYTHSRTACDAYEWEMKPGVTYYESQRDSVFVPAVSDEDCDTWYFLDLTLGHDTLIDAGSMTECEGFEWHGVPYYADAIVYDSLQTPVTHCDSILSYHLTIVHPVDTLIEMESCRPVWWEEHYCDEEGDYVHVYQSIVGCDSIVTMHFSLAEELKHEFDSVACNAIYWYGNQCDTDGMTYSHVFETQQGCDSLAIMHFHLQNEVSINPTNISACDSYEYHGQLFDIPGVYTINGDTIQSLNGCDSIIEQIVLEIKNSELMGQISGSAWVYVASNLVSGLYRYEIDNTGMISDVVWSLSNPEWQIVEANNQYCRIFVGTPGFGTLKAHFSVEECGEIDRLFDINADFFDTDEYQAIQVNVFPNPTRGSVTIEAEDILRVRLIDMMGQTLVVHDGIKQDHFTLDMSALSPSVYVLEIETTKGRVRKQVVLCK